MTRRSTSSSDRGPDWQPGAETSQPSLNEIDTEAIERGGDLVDRGTEVGIQQADRGLQLAAEGAEGIAATMRRVSGDLRTDQPQIAEVASAAADQAEAIARILHETDMRQIVSSVEERARRQPLLFIGGAFVLGVAASRLVRGAGR